MSPTFDFKCQDCGKVTERVIFTTDLHISCDACQSVNMTRLYTAGHFNIKSGYPLWVDRIDEHQKRQEDKGKSITVPAARDVL